MMKRDIRTILGVTILLVFGVMAFVNFNRTIAPYVPFAEARAASGAVQVAGFPDHRAATFDTESGMFMFSIEDEAGDVLKVHFDGVRPGNFDQAEKIVVIGKYDDEIFTASQILVKCPSKYDDQAAERWESYSSDGDGHPEEIPRDSATDAQATDTPATDTP
jgi:cytochrome c-type biogenesis protein CcmE